MSKYLVLTKTLFKNSFSVIDQGNKKKSKKILSILLLGFIFVSFIPTLFALFFLTRELVKILEPLNQQAIVIGLLFQVASTMVLFFGVFLIPAVFYFTKDIETLLPLPLSPLQLISSKFTVAFVYETLLILFLILPILIGYYSLVSIDLVQLLFLIIGVLSFSLVPLILVSVLVMIIMSSVDLFKNRDLFNMLSGMIILVLVIWFNITVGGFGSISEGELLSFLLEGNNSLLAIFRYAIPTIPFLIDAVVDGAWIGMGLYLLLTVAIVSAFLLTGHLLYFKGVIGINETASSRKQLSSKQLSASLKTKHPLISYFVKEVKLLWRTPVYFLNCVSVNVLLPAIFLVPMLFGQQVSELDLVALLPLGDPLITNIAIALGIGLGLVLGTINMISATAISREGSGYYFIKVIPMSIMQQLHSKAFSGIFFSWIGIIFTIAPIALIRSLPLNIMLTMLIFALFGSVIINYFALLVDVIRPKLVWESEQAAVKQNLNFLFTLAPAAGAAFGLGYLVFNVYITPLWMIIGASVGILILLVGIIVLLQKVGVKTLLSSNA